jgi:NAD(P)H-dependent FMN reductase
VLERLAKLIKSCHAVIVVAGEYNHSIQPALPNLLDHFLGGHSSLSSCAGRR